MEITEYLKWLLLIGGVIWAVVLDSLETIVRRRAVSFYVVDLGQDAVTQLIK